MTPIEAERILTALADPIFLVDAQGNIVQVYNTDSFHVGDNIVTMVIDEHKTIMTRKIENAFTHQQIQQCDIFSDSDPNIAYHLQLYPLVEADVVRLCVILARQMKRDSEFAYSHLPTGTLFESIMQHSRDTIALSHLAENFNGTSFALSRSYEDLTGYSIEDSLNLLRPQDIYSEEELLDMQQKAKKTIDGEDVEPYERRITHKDGHEVIVEVHPSTVRDHYGNPQYHLVIARDITERKRNEEKLQQTLQAADAASAAKSQFLANMSHELRSPLNAVLGYSEILSHDENLTPDQKRQLEIVRYSGRHLLEVINEILDMAKIEAGAVQLRLVDYDLHRMLYGICDMFSLRVQEKDITLKVTIGGRVPHIVRGDEAKLRQALVNVLSNAIKFTDLGSVHVSADFDDQLQIQITDTGIGIDQGELEQLFIPFQQAKNGYQQGTGLGLAITQSYIHLMGGTIAVNSQIGEGTTFSIRLPLDVVETQPVPVQEHLAVFDIPGSERYRILVVDDRAEFRDLVSDALRRAKFQVCTAQNGQAAIAEVTVCQPHLILMDLDMPVMDGQTAAERIRMTYPDIIMIAVTASAFEDADALKERGFQKRLLKPLPIATLLLTVCDHLKLGIASHTTRDTTPHPVRNRVAAIPVDIRDILMNSALALDIAGTQSAINAVMPYDSSLADWLQTCLDQFQFDRIKAMLLDASPE